MIVSGGKILAIDKVNTDGTTVVGDGVAKPLSATTFTVTSSGDNVQVFVDNTDPLHVIYAISANGTGGGGIADVNTQYPVTGGSANEPVGLATQFTTDISASSGYAYSAWSAISGFKLQSDTTSILSVSAQGNVWHLSANCSGMSAALTDSNGFVSGNGLQGSAIGLTDTAISAINLVVSANTIWESAKYIPELSAAIANKQDAGAYVSVDALSSISGTWNVASAISGVSGYGYSAWSAVSAYDLSKFVTSSINTISAGVANVLVKDANDAVTWSAVDLTSLGKMYNISSVTPNIVTAGISATETDTFYFVSANDELENISTWKAQMEQSAAALSAYITDNAAAWSANTTYALHQSGSFIKISAVSSKDKSHVDYYISAVGGGEAVTYAAGDWIDAEALADNKISVSGYKPLNVADPLYYAVNDETDEVTLKIDGTKLVTSKATIIANGYADDSTPKQLTSEGISATVPEMTDDEQVWKFKFSEPMVVQVCINADFVPDTAKYIDSYDEVGFNGIKNVTNDIKFTMFGYAPQHYNASTVTTVPEGEVEFKFNRGAQSGFIKEIKNPCITIQQI